MRLERRLRFKAGQVFALYLMVYTAGRVWIEALRIDDAHRILGVRLNVWTSLLVFAPGEQERHGAGTPEEGAAAVESGAPRADGPGGALTGGNDGEDAGPDRD